MAQNFYLNHPITLSLDSLKYGMHIYIIFLFENILVSKPNRLRQCLCPAVITNIEYSETCNGHFRPTFLDPIISASTSEHRLD